MNKKQFGIFFSLLVLVAGVFLLWQQPESPISPNADTSTQKEQKADEAEQDESDNKTVQAQDEEPDETTKEPVSQLQELLNEAVQRTMDFFTKEEMHVTAIGDSLTQGVGDDVVEGGYVGILEGKINQNKQLVSFDNYGKRGNRSDQLLKRLDKPEIEQSIKRADIILITIGANDIMQVLKQNFTSLEMSDFEQPQETYKRQLQEIFQTMKDLNDDAAIYLIGFYNPFGRYFQDIEELNTIVKNWNQTGETVTSQFKQTNFIPIADLFNTTDGDDDLLADDHFHPNHRGYQLFARRVLDYITD
ncbi:SGNH/GDSL hydrolase family protein [Lentibacillus juripiscarius]|uniref:SGNH/GDSL hydrolase family protein n=1 Tax=Lentibacillus juripiscarius TaxID=257446 RepID=A0ABW5V8R8_9BACI